MWRLDTPNNSPRRDSEVVVYATDSLRNALGALEWTFTCCSGVLVRSAYGYAGILRRRIECGDRADLFAATELRHPKALLARGHARAIAVFARNPLCVVAMRRIGLTLANLLDRMLDPGLVLGIFPASDDPLGGYTRMMFRRCEALCLGSCAQLEAKARIMAVVSMNGARDLDAHDLAVSLLQHGVIDVHVCYRSTAQNLLVKALPELDIVELPPPIAVASDCALAILRDAVPATVDLARFILSSHGKAILLQHGFEPTEQTATSDRSPI